MSLELFDVSLTTPNGSRYLLENISFAVSQGDRLAIIGTVGSGKTTLLRLLNRLSTPVQGKIYFNNEDIRNIAVFKLRSMIALVLQEPKLLGMTVAEALAYPLVLQKQTPAIINQRVDYWREQLQIPDSWLDRNELQLSLGQRQQVAIARALILEPQILLLDEPTSALDMAVAHNLMETLSFQAQSRQMTIIMVNHQLNLVQQFANRIIWLNQGKIYQDTQSSSLDWQILEQKFKELSQQNGEEW